MQGKGIVREQASWRLAAQLQVSGEEEPAKMKGERQKQKQEQEQEQEQEQ